MVKPLGDSTAVMVVLGVGAIGDGIDGVAAGNSLGGVVALGDLLGIAIKVGLGVGMTGDGIDSVCSNCSFMGAVSKALGVITGETAGEAMGEAMGESRAYCGASAGATVGAMTFGQNLTNVTAPLRVIITFIHFTFALLIWIVCTELSPKRGTSTS
jgi:hypothetical protein